MRLVCRACGILNSRVENEVPSIAPGDPLPSKLGKGQAGGRKVQITARPRLEGGGAVL